MSLVQTIGEAIYNNVQTGQIEGSATATQLPTVPSRRVCFKALSGNAGKFYLGSSASLTAPVPSSASNTTAGFTLSPGDVSPWFPVDNLNRFWGLSDNVADTLTYVVVD